jgi:uncharacterized surface protein with fasciclin (FAS1) repeats
MFKRTALALATTAAFATSAFAMGHSKDIVDTAAAAGSFTTLLAAAEAAGLVETLKGEGPLTVFAPTDEAFAALPEGTVETLLLPENRDQLVAILTYHVIAGAVMSGDLSDDMTAATVQGADITIDLDNGVMVNDANVVTADIEASNGVIHVIDNSADVNARDLTRGVSRLSGGHFDLNAPRHHQVWGDLWPPPCHR